MTDETPLVPPLGEDSAEGAARFTGRQMQQYFAVEKITEAFGKFDQGVGPDGAHYVPKSPFGDEGLVCASCIFYEGPRGCEVVDGDIAPEGICKLWVIPGDLVREPVTPVAQDSKAAAPGTERPAAMRLARRLGCEGAHQLEDGSWAPCPTPEALQATVRGGAKGYATWRESQGLDESMTKAAPQSEMLAAKVRAEVQRFNRVVDRRAATLRASAKA